MSAVRPFLIPMLAVGLFAATLGWFGYRSMTNRVATDGGSATASTPSPPPLIPEKAAVAPPLAEPNGIAAVPVLPSATPPVVPAFDVVRVEPNGEAVIAGRASPGATVELLGNGTRRSRVVADPSGLFALVPEALPPGDHELVLQIANADGTKVRSAQSVTVVVAPGGRTAPLVTVTAPGQPAVVLSRPDAPPAGPTPMAAARTSTAPAPAGATNAPPPGKTPRPAVQILSVETEGAGKLLVSAGAAPTANVRLYLNETFVAPASASKDGRVAFAIERGMQPGSYKIRLDDVDPVSGEVRSRAEVPFVMPRQVAETGPAQASPPSSRLASPTAERVASATRPIGPPPRSQSDALGADMSKMASASLGIAEPDAPPTVVIPQINTAVVSRGDSLWAISKKAYGAGLRYTVIYGANTTQIRDPNLIYPGQLFVLPANGQDTASR